MFHGSHLHRLSQLGQQTTCVHGVGTMSKVLIYSCIDPVCATMLTSHCTAIYTQAWRGACGSRPDDCSGQQRPCRGCQGPCGGPHCSQVSSRDLKVQGTGACWHVWQEMSLGDTWIQSSCIVFSFIFQGQSYVRNVYWGLEKLRSRSNHGPHCGPEAVKTFASSVPQILQVSISSISSILVQATMHVFCKSESADLGLLSTLYMKRVGGTQACPVAHCHICTPVANIVKGDVILLLL